MQMGGKPKYKYIVARMDKNGQFCRDEKGNLDIKGFTSENNVMLCVNANDINSDNFS